MKGKTFTDEQAEAIRRVIRRRMATLGTNAKRVSEEAGMKPGYLREFLGPERPRTGDYTPKKNYIDIPSIAEALGLNSVALSEGVLMPLLVPIVGYAGAGPDGTVLFAEGDENFGEVEAPPGSTEETRAAEVKGTSMRGIANDGWLIFFDEPTLPSEEHLGEPCVCWLEDGRVLVKEPARGSGVGLFHLLSVNADPMLDIPVRQMALVIDIKPRRAAQKFIRKHKSPTLSLVVNTTSESSEDIDLETLSLLNTWISLIADRQDIAISRSQKAEVAMTVYNRLKKQHVIVSNDNKSAVERVIREEMRNAVA